MCAWVSVCLSSYRCVCGRNTANVLQDEINLIKTFCKYYLANKCLSDILCLSTFWHIIISSKMGSEL